MDLRDFSAGEGILYQKTRLFCQREALFLFFKSAVNQNIVIFSHPYFTQKVEISLKSLLK
jgi:hypothetical protein